MWKMMSIGCDGFAGTFFDKSQSQEILFDEFQSKEIEVYVSFPKVANGR